MRFKLSLLSEGEFRHNISFVTAKLKGWVYSNDRMTSCIGNIERKKERNSVSTHCLFIILATIHHCGNTMSHLQCLFCFHNFSPLYSSPTNVHFLPLRGGIPSRTTVESTMTFFPPSSTVLEYCGIYPSPAYYSGWKKILYDFYTLSIVILISTFCLSGSIQLFLFTNSVTEFAANCYMLVTFIAALIKIFIVISKRECLPETFGFTLPISFRPKNQEEIQIQSKWDPQSRFVFILIMLRNTSTMNIFLWNDSTLLVFPETALVKVV
uniref:Olfactory receptor 56 n=1 Tax=Meteorus pulchricornis TaxID=51522 RepID=A0A1S5VFP6_9HYME|nr:olfactory receptor 56 [Meteorus pulchricornis]